MKTLDSPKRKNCEIAFIGPERNNPRFAFSEFERKNRGFTSEQTMSSLERKNRGFTFIELIIVLSIMALLFTLSYRSLQTAFMRQERKLYLSGLKDALAFARSEAFFRNTTISLCASHSQQKCHRQNDWSSGYIIFANPHHDIEPNPDLILRVVPGTRYGKVHFNGISPILNISAQGLTMNIGTFLYCPKATSSQKQAMAGMAGLVVNRAFRSYFLEENESKAAELACE